MHTQSGEYASPVWHAEGQPIGWYLPENLTTSTASGWFSSHPLPITQFLRLVLTGVFVPRTGLCSHLSGHLQTPMARHDTGYWTTNYPRSCRDIIGSLVFSFFHGHMHFPSMAGFQEIDRFDSPKTCLDIQLLICSQLSNSPVFFVHSFIKEGADGGKASALHGKAWHQWELYAA